MEKYDYYDAVLNDVKDFVKSNIDLSAYEDRDELENYLNDVLFVEDSVTGNASGSYTFNSFKAEENLCHNLDLLGEALEYFGSSGSYLVDNGAEACDVTIRCYLLPRAINEVLNELYD